MKVLLPSLIIFITLNEPACFSQKPVVVSKIVAHSISGDQAFCIYDYWVNSPHESCFVILEGKKHLRRSTCLYSKSGKLEKFYFYIPEGHIAYTRDDLLKDPKLVKHFKVQLVLDISINPKTRTIRDGKDIRTYQKTGQQPVYLVTKSNKAWINIYELK